MEFELGRENKDLNYITNKGILKVYDDFKGS